jgi:hypothetical protein
MALVPRCINPFIPPAHNAAHPQPKNLLNLDMCLGRLAEKFLPELRYSRLANVSGTVRGRIRILEDTILSHQLHHPGYIMPVESIIKIKDDANSGF